MDVRDVCLSFLRPGEGVFCRILGGVVPPGHSNWALASTAAHTHTANTMGVTPPGFEVFCIREYGSTSNACFVYVTSGTILFTL